jgi:CRISPR-associated endoribonuclease Cas6
MLDKVSFEIVGMDFIRGKRSGEVNYLDLIARKDSQSIQSFGLHFISATAFHSKNQNILFPLPELIFPRLLKRWNLFCPEDCQMNDDQFNEIIANSIMVTAYQLQTHALDFGVKGTEIGFSGSCFYKIKNSVPNKIKEIIHVLIMFSFFAGIGYGSPKGMGQINYSIDP